MVMATLSPRITVPNQTEARLPRVTLPITDAFSAIYTCSASCGRLFLYGLIIFFPLFSCGLYAPRLVHILYYTYLSFPMARVFYICQRTFLLLFSPPLSAYLGQAVPYGASSARWLTLMNEFTFFFISQSIFLSNCKQSSKMHTFSPQNTQFFVA